MVDSSTTDSYTSAIDMPDKKKKRHLEVFEPCGPIRAMIENELRGKSRGAKVRLFEDALAQYLGPRYPKLQERFQILCEEGLR